MFICVCVIGGKEVESEREKRGGVCAWGGGEGGGGVGGGRTGRETRSNYSFSLLVYLLIEMNLLYAMPLYCMLYRSILIAPAS